MEDGKVREGVDEAIERGGGELEAIEVNGCHGESGFVIRRIVTVEAFVFADIRADPCLCDAKRVRSDESFEALNDGVHHGQSLV